MMQTIKKIESVNPTTYEIANKVNEILSAGDIEKEEPIYEVLSPGDCLVISKNKEGLLVACLMSGKIELKRVNYPEGAI